MLTLTLQLTQSTVAPDQPLEATFTLTNTGVDSIPVNRRLSLNHPDEIEECRELYLRVLDEAGEEIRFAAWLRVPELTSEDFASLAPGESVSQTYNLLDFYTLARPGTYSIQAVYENIFAPAGGEAWQGKLESNAVTCRLS